MYFCLKRFFYSVAIPVLVLVASYMPSQAQHRSDGMNADGDILRGSKSGGGLSGYITSNGWSVAANGGFELPLGDLKGTYKGAPTFGLTLSKKIKHNIFSAGADYRAYHPKESVFTDESFGFPINFYYSSFTGINAYVGVAHEWLISNSVSFHAGVNGGYMITQFDMIIETAVEIQSFSQKSNIPYLGPKLGINLALTNKINIGAETRYHFSIAKSNIDPAEGGNITNSLKSVAGNLFLTYNF